MIFVSRPNLICSHDGVKSQDPIASNATTAIGIGNRRQCHRWRDGPQDGYDSGGSGDSDDAPRPRFFCFVSLCWNTLINTLITVKIRWAFSGNTLEIISIKDFCCLHVNRKHAIITVILVLAWRLCVFPDYLLSGDCSAEGLFTTTIQFW